MTSKEALDSILSYFDFDYYKHKNIYNCTKIIKQDLERLETLEKKNKDLEEMLSVANYVGCGEAEKVWDLTQENEKFKKAIENILEYAKCELDSIEIVDRIENILKDNEYYG